MAEKDLTLKFRVTDEGTVVLDKISSKISEIESNTGKMSSSLGLIKLDSIINLGERAFHTGQQIYNMARNVASSINDIDRMAKISGLSSEQFQKLSYAAKMADVDTESLGRGMKILAGHMEDVRKGNAEAVFLFQSIGLSTTDAAGKTKSFDEILGDLANRFKMMPDGVEKVALATDLFGRTGQNLIPMLNKGSEGLREFYQEAEKLGIVLDESLLKKGSELEDKFKKVEAWWSSFFKKIVVGAYEAIEALEKLIEKGAEAGSDIAERSRQATADWKRKRGYPESEIPKPTRKEVSMFSVGDIGLEKVEEIPAYFRQSEEAIKAMAEALKKTYEEEVKLNVFFANDVELLKQANREVENRNKAMDIMEKLGIKTKIGAQKEIDAIEEQFKSLLGKGYSLEEMAQAKEKLLEELKKVQEKYSMKPGEEGPGGRWEEIIVPSGKEISGIHAKTTWESDWRWIEDIGVKSNEAKDKLTRNVEEMVNKSIEELNRMQRQMESLTTVPQKIMIDTSQFDSVSQGIDVLRQKMESLTSQTYPLRISIVGGERAGITDIYQIDNEFTNLAQNKRSKFMELVKQAQAEE